jgi:AraC family ethanolamine operon transcriptional activator
MLDFKMTPGDILILSPNHELYSRFFGANHYVATFIEPDELFAFLATQPGAQDSAVWRQPNTLLVPDRTTAAANVKQMSFLLDVLAEHGPRLSDEAAKFYRLNILEMLTAPVRNAALYQGQRLRPSAALVREVDRYLANSGSRPIHIAELSAKFNVHRRLLHRAFEDIHGVPPITFLRRTRLSHVHAALLTAAPPATVKEIAIEHGFAELGRFAAEYRRMFGELPSQTLRRAQC